MNRTARQPVQAAPDVQEVLESLLPALYETAVVSDAMKWGRFMGVVARAFDADAASIMTVDKQMGRPLLIQGSGLGPGSWDTFRFSAEEDLLYQASLADPSDTVVMGSGSISIEEHHNSRFYREILGPAQLDWFIGARFENTPTTYSANGIFRRRGRPDFGPREKRLLHEFTSHLRVAIRVARRLSQAEGARRASFAALGFTRQGVVLLDRSGRVLFLNDEARRMTGDRDGIAIRAGHLWVGDEVGQRELRTILEGAVALPARRRARPEEGRFRVSRPSGRLPYELVVIGLEGRFAGDPYFPDGSTYQVLISDPTEVFGVPRELLVDTYGLSVNQARLCQCLLRGESLESAARQMGIGPHSARTHLRRAFAKLGVSSQLELMLMLGSSIRRPDAAAQARAAAGGARQPVTRRRARAPASGR